MLHGVLSDPGSAPRNKFRGLSGATGNLERRRIGRYGSRGIASLSAATAQMRWMMAGRGVAISPCS